MAAEQRSPEAERLLEFLHGIEGKKTLSGTMANVSWNTNEAQWVHQHTGRWPVLNCFDYIHLPYSAKGGWIDYSDIREIEAWHREGGVVCLMWHWNVPANQSGKYAFYWGTEPEKTTFDVRKVFEPESDEYRRMVSDIDRVAECLRLLKDAGIPVLWRPLHEAGGMWFWWGRDAEACNALWRLMYRRFREAGLDNLIWVWTQAAAWGKPYSDGYRWYPGDDVVDIVSIDIYNNSDAERINSECYRFLKEHSPGKMAALTECGGVADIAAQWAAGARWLFFMPWYDYGRTAKPGSAAFGETAHGSCDAAWWQRATENEFVLWREQLKILKIKSEK